MATMFAINTLIVYISVGIYTGYNIAYRIAKLRKLSKKESLVFAITFIISLPMLLLSIGTLFAFKRKEKLEKVPK